MQKNRRWLTAACTLALVQGGWLWQASPCHAQIKQIQPAQPAQPGQQSQQTQTGQQTQQIQPGQTTKSGNIVIKTLPRVVGGYLGDGGVNSPTPFNNPATNNPLSNTTNNPFGPSTSPFGPTTNQFAPQAALFQQNQFPFAQQGQFQFLPQGQMQFFPQGQQVNPLLQFPANGVFQPLGVGINNPFVQQGFFNGNFGGFGGFGGGVAVGQPGFAGFGGFGGGQPVLGLR